MSRTTCSGKPGKYRLLDAFPDNSCDPYILGDLLYRIDPEHPGLDQFSLKRSKVDGEPGKLLTYDADRELCLKIAKDLEEKGPSVFHEHFLHGSRVAPWYSGGPVSESVFLEWVTVKVPRYFRRLKYGWRCVG